MTTTQHLMAEPLPRSRETVEALGRPAVLRIRRAAWFGGGMFVVVALFTCTVTGLFAEPENALVVIAIVGALPAWAVAQFMLSDAAVCFDLVREARAYRATLVAMRTRRLGATSTRVASIAWTEYGQRVLGYVTLISKIDPPDPEDIVVLVGPNRIGVVFGDQGMFVGAFGTGRFWF